jgi:cytochrome P460
MKFASVLVTLLLLCAVGFSSELPPSNPKINSKELLLPANYHNWVTLSPSTPGLPSHRHKHVASKLFVEPTAFEHFTKTGEWPNNTVIVLELRSAKARVRSKSEVMGLEAAVKNEASFPDPWTYYGIIYDRPQQPSGTLNAEKPCDCDQPLDSMLAMAFPTLRAVINAKPSSMSQTLF